MSPDGARILDALPEPALILQGDGWICVANSPARTNFGLEPGSHLLEGCPQVEASEALRVFLARASGSRAALPGIVHLRDTAGTSTAHRALACLLRPAQNGERAQLLLRIGTADERFAALSQKFRELHEEIRRRARTQALLEQALRERDILSRELHHRVKNNIHMIAAMLSTAQREASNPEIAATFAEAARRLGAMGTVHQMLYRDDSLEAVPGQELITRLTELIADGAGRQVVVDAAPVNIANDQAVPLALILNELLTNALKYGKRADGTAGRISVRLGPADLGYAELCVEDEGPGFNLGQPMRHGSGLGLVQGLVGQLGGSFRVTCGVWGGARCLVRFEGARMSEGTRS